MKFVKRPIEIDAVTVKEAQRCAASDWKALPSWLSAAYEGKNAAGVRGIVFAQDGVHIITLEGVMLASPDDWIICGLAGELYPCKPDIFAATYEQVPALSAGASEGDQPG